MARPDALAGKLARYLVATFAFLALLVGVYFAHMRWLPVTVVLYAALADVLACVLLAALALWRLPALATFNSFEKLLALLSWALIGYCLAISVPTVIDRSLSFYILEKIQQRGGGLRADRLEDVFVHEYMREHHLAEVRLTEQIASGTVEVVDGCVQLTAQGERAATFSRFFRRHFLPRERLLLGRPTDALVDPFRNGAPDSGASCRPRGNGNPGRKK